MPTALLVFLFFACISFCNNFPFVAETNDKFFKSYNSSTSHGSSHTSGIESDSKQRTEEEEEDGTV